MNSQLRQDLVSGDWIVIAPGRAKRPHQLIKKPEKRLVAPKAGCPFENPQKSGHGRPILIYGNRDWRLQIVENKFPAFRHRDNKCAVIAKNGPYAVTETVGHHEVVITRSHTKNFAMLSETEANQVFEAFRDRYLMLLNDKCISYISIFHNWGPKAGASVYHPHYQIISIPVVPPDVEHSLEGSLKFYRQHKKCVHCVMISEELKHKRRILYQNEGAIAFCPFVSKEPFEVRIFPKKHLPYYENTLDHDLSYVVKALQKALKKIKKNLKDPDYNFFIHTAPIRNKEKYTQYHWHIEARPKITTAAGFELGTGIEINVVDPDDAAHLLRK
jgi:UDPglucose--hexose-1-phosphate uridylyltransferase